MTLLVMATGCEKSELVRYEEPAMIYVYREAFNNDGDSVAYSFAIKANNLQVDTIKVPVRIMGDATNTDREVKLAVIADSTTAVEGTHYEFLPYHIPAGEFSADLPVLVKRTADLKNQEVRLLLQVTASKDFQPGIPHSPVAGNFAGAGLKYLVKINDFLTKPSNWDTRLIYYFGTYSQVKFKFIIDITGITDFPVGSPPAFSFGEMQYYNAFCKSKLSDHETANGPLLDEFGLPVTFP